MNWRWLLRKWRAMFDKPPFYHGDGEDACPEEHP